MGPNYSWFHFVKLITIKAFVNLIQTSTMKLFGKNSQRLISQKIRLFDWVLNMPPLSSFWLGTVKNTVNSPNFLMWKFCRKAQFTHNFGNIIPGNLVKLLYFWWWIKSRPFKLQTGILMFLLFPWLQKCLLWILIL